MPEFEGLQHLDHLFEMSQADADLIAQRKWPRRAHFARDRKGEILGPLLVDFDDAGQQLHALGRAGESETRESPLCRRHRLVDIRLGAERNLRERILVGRVDHVEDIGNGRVHPGAVDIELQFM